MPEVIDLLSSTPPQPTDKVQKPSVTAALPNQSTIPSSQNFLSSDFEASLFTYDDIGIDKPVTKKRRLTPEIEITSPAWKNTTSSPPPAANNSLFVFSDDEAAFLPPSNQEKANATTKTYKWNADGSDPIVFTSSALEPAARPVAPQRVVTVNKRTATATITIDDDDRIEEFSDPFALPDDVLNFEPPRLSRGLSDRTAGLLASLEGRSKTGGGVASRQGRNNKEIGAESDGDLSDVVVPPPKQRKTGKATAVDKEAKAREREAAKAQREREREKEKERKRKQKEEKAREKQLAADIAEVNKLKVDKKNSTPEMIVDVASSLGTTSVGNQVTEFMRRLGVECNFSNSTIPNIVKWRRKVVANFNEELGHWEPCPLHIRQEEHVLCLLSAQEFVDMAIADTDSDDTLELHVLKIKSAYPDCKPIYLIEGLTAWMRRNKNSRNRAYQAEVLRQFEQNTGRGAAQSETQSRRKAKKPETTPPVDDDAIEDALLQLQVAHSCLIHHTAAAAESAEWIKNFTEHVSTIPYRRERMDLNDSAFCMDVGQVKSGEDKSDTFIKMLEEVNRVTAPMAYGIAAKYPSVVDLVRGMRVHGPAMLEDVKKSANKNGALTESRIGPAVSRRLYKVFMGRDASSTDI